MTSLLVKTAACAAFLAICDSAGDALQKKPLVTALACSVAAVCSAYTTYEIAQKAKKYVEIGAPVAGETLKQIGRQFKK